MAYRFSVKNGADILKEVRIEDKSQLSYTGDNRGVIIRKLDNFNTDDEITATFKSKLEAMQKTDKKTFHYKRTYYITFCRLFPISVLSGIHFRPFFSLFIQAASAIQTIPSTGINFDYDMFVLTFESNGNKVPFISILQLENSPLRDNLFRETTEVSYHV